MNTKKHKPKFRSVCPIASTLDLVGDKWSLLIVRDLLRGKATYTDLASSPEKIPTNILAERLKRMESSGLILSSVYHERPVRYAYNLTAKGEALGGILVALARWGKNHIAGTKTYTEIAKAGQKKSSASTMLR
jgi:DNA-binding HxlR family transcriptional regulator